MAGSLGTISGQVRLDAAQALAAFAAIRSSSAASSGALAAAGSKMKAFGKVSTVAGLALVAAFGVAVKAAADFEKKMDYFGAINNTTGKQLDIVKKKALELGQTSQFSAGQIADAFVEMGKAGVSVKDITGGLADAIVNLASAADIKLDEATNIVTSQIQTYSLKAKDAAHVTDVLAGAANASIIDVSDLATSLKYVGGVANSLGISFDSTVDAISLLGKAGIKGSTAGTSLRQIMVSLAGGTNKAKGELEDLGIITDHGTKNAFFTATGQAKSLDQVFQILQDHTKNLSQEQQLMAYKVIFNNRALAAAEILTKAGAGGFASMNKEISKTTAADVAAKRLDNLSGDVQKLKSSIETLLIRSGTPFQGFLRGIVQGITQVIKWFGNLPSGVQQAILTFVAVTGVILTLVGTVALVGGTVLKFLSVVKEMSAAFKLAGKGIRIFSGAMRALSATALANPYVLIALAVIALVAGFILLYKKSETFRNAVNKVGAAIKTGFLATVNWFKTLPKWFEDRWNDIKAAFSVSIAWIKKNWDILLTIFTGPLGAIVLVWRRFGDQITNFFQAIPGKVATFVVSALSAAGNFAKQLPYLIGYAIGYVLGLLVKLQIEGAQKMAQWAIDTYNTVTTWFSKLPGRIESFFVGLINWWIQWQANFAVQALAWVIRVYNSITGWFAKLPSRVYNFFVSLYHSVTGVWNSITSGSERFATNTYNRIVNWFSKLPGRIYTLAVNTKNNAISAFNSMLSTCISIASNLYNGFIGWINKLPGVVWGALNSAISAFKSMVTAAYNAAKDFASGLWDGFKKGLGINSPSLIEKQMWQITQVTQAETSKLATTVRTMQGLHRSLQQNDVGKTAVAMNTSTLANLTSSMTKQAAILNSAGSAIYASSGVTSPASIASRTASSASNGSGIASDGSPVGQNINVTVNNPVAEKSSDSVARKLRQLSDMGAL